MTRIGQPVIVFFVDSGAHPHAIRSTSSTRNIYTLYCFPYIHTSFYTYFPYIHFSRTTKKMATFLTIPADCKLAIILAMREGNAADCKTFLALLTLCKATNQLVCANLDRLVEHYAYKITNSTKIMTLFCDQPHSINDMPAVICKNTGDRMWFHYGKLHRSGSSSAESTDLPAVIHYDGSCEWWQNGECHRDTVVDNQVQPAIIWADGSREWWRRGKLHRSGAPGAGSADLPAIDYVVSKARTPKVRKVPQPNFVARVLVGQEWWVDGARHRDNDLPAVIYTSGRKEWWWQGKLHRDPVMVSRRLARSSPITILVEQPAVVHNGGYNEWWKHGKRYR